MNVLSARGKEEEKGRGTDCNVDFEHGVQVLSARGKDKEKGRGTDCNARGRREYMEGILKGTEEGTRERRRE